MRGLLGLPHRIIIGISPMSDQIVQRRRDLRVVSKGPLSQYALMYLGLESRTSLLE